MRRYYIAFGILLILPSIDFAIAAPVLVQEKRQVGADVVQIPADTVTMLGKRGDEFVEPFFVFYEDHIEKPKVLSSLPPGPSDGWTNLNQPLPSIPETPSPESSPGRESSISGPLTESGYDLMEGDVPSGPSKSNPTSSTMSGKDHELVETHVLQNPGPLTESGHDLMGVHALLSSPVFPTWFHTAHVDHGLIGEDASRPNSGSSTELDSDHKLVVEEPPSRPASPTEFDADHVLHPPSQSLALSITNRVRT